MKSSNRRVFFEVLIILIVMTVCSLLVRQLRDRSNPGGGLLHSGTLPAPTHLVRIGFKPKTFFKDLLANWWLVVLVGFVTQIIPILIGKTILPEYLTHIQEACLSMSPVASPCWQSRCWLPPWPRNWLPCLIPGAFGVGIGTPLALALVVLVFAAMHWAPGKPVVVLQIWLRCHRCSDLW